MVHADYKEMIPAHALSTLDAAEARALDDHLSECDECRMELQEWEATAAAMAVSVNPMEPSPEVRERILSEIRKDLSMPQVIPFRSATRNVWTSFGSLGAIAAVILVAVLIVGVVVLWRENRAAQASMRAMTAQLDKMQKDLKQSNEFFQLVTSPGTRMMELDGTSEAAGATAKLAYDKTGHAMLVAHGLPRVPAGKEYQLWYIVSGKPPMPGKAFAPDDSGSATSTEQMPAVALDADVFAITLEPAGGVESPTGAMYLRTNPPKTQ
jgi:anti-sigma-K factor RskA